MNARTKYSVVVLALVLCACKKTPEQKAADALEKGKQYLAKKDNSSAILEFRIALKNSPRNAEVFYQAGLTYLNMLDVASAYINFKKAVELDPKHAGAQGRLAELLSASHDPTRLKEAGQIASDILKQSPEDEAAVNSLAISKFELGDKAGAEEALRELVEEGKADARTTVNLALMRFYAKDNQGAIEVLKKGVATNPKSSELALVLGRAYGANNDAAGAEREFKRAAELDPKSGAAWSTLASFYAASGRQAEAEKAYRSAAQSGDPKFKFFLGMYYWTTHRADLAITEFRRLAEQDPKDRDARRRLVAALRQNGHEDQAEEVLRRAFERNPKDIEAGIEHAQSLARSGKLDDAAVALRLLLNDSQDSAQVHFVLSKVYAAKRQFGLQQEELAEALKRNPMFLAARLDLSQSLLANGRVDAALDALDKAPRDQQTALPWLIARNWTLLRKHDLSAAEASINTTLKQRPSNEALLQRAFLEIEKKQLPAARGDLQKVLQADPNSVRALDALGSTYVAEKNVAGAIQAVGEHASKYPKSIPLQFAYSLWLSRAGKIEQAKAVLNAAKAVNPGDLSFDVRLGELDLGTGDLQGARAALSGVLAKNPKIARAQMLMGHVESISGNRDAAVKCYRAVLGLEPDNSEALNNLGSILTAKAETLDEGLSFAQKAKELSPADPNVSDTLGWALYQKGFYAAALPQLEDAQKSQNPVVIYHLAMVHVKTGDKEKAATELARAEKLAPKMAEAKQAAELLAR